MKKTTSIHEYLVKLADQIKAAEDDYECAVEVGDPEEIAYCEEQLKKLRAFREYFTALV